MTATNRTSGIGDIEILANALRWRWTRTRFCEDFTHYFGRTFGRRTVQCDSPFVYQALV